MMISSSFFVRVIKYCVSLSRHQTKKGSLGPGKAWTTNTCCSPKQRTAAPFRSYIEEKGQKVDTLITDLQTEIEYLREYKQRLIADVVTGLVNVQNEI